MSPEDIAEAKHRSEMEYLESCVIDYINKGEFQKAIDYLKKLIEEERAATAMGAGGEAP